MLYLTEVRPLIIFFFRRPGKLKFFNMYLERRDIRLFKVIIQNGLFSDLANKNFGMGLSLLNGYPVPKSTPIN